MTTNRDRDNELTTVLGLIAGYDSGTLAHAQYFNIEAARARVRVLRASIKYRLVGLAELRDFFSGHLSEAQFDELLAHEGQLVTVVSEETEGYYNVVTAAGYKIKGLSAFHLELL
jgi:hypothetical protein